MMQGNKMSLSAQIGFQLLLITHFTRAADEISAADKPIPLVSVEGVLKQQGKLPCDVQAPTRHDTLHMVLWFRDNGQPIYRYDVRRKPLSDAKRWSDIGDRLYFQVMSEPAHLLINNLRLQDEGVYRCRVDFKNSPTRNHRINLTIIVPPDIPVIFDSNGVASQNIGPYNEGSELMLICEVFGGRPKPRVTWWLENEMIDDSSLDRKDGVIVNHLKFSPLQRQHLNARFICLASNTNQTLPLSATAILNLNLRPLSVVITSKDVTLIAENQYEIECHSHGARPPATITWWKNGRDIKKSSQNPHAEDKNITRSVLTLIPNVDDDSKILTCRSENAWIIDSAIEDRWRLNVHYSPRLTMQLGSNLVADDIKEGADVYFECTVKSNPAYIRLTWFHDDIELRHNLTQRIIMSNTRLVLQKVTRHSAGGYYCSAYNTEGLTQSNVVQLRIKYVPLCKSKVEVLIGAMKNETIVVRCEMEANPPTVQFFWTFNNSGMEVTSIVNSRFSSSGTVSTFNYTPTAAIDYGTLSCWGSNSIGQGTEEPCRFQIVQAGPPQSPKNCSMHNETEDSATVSCTEGFHGGLSQIFHIEVYDTQRKHLRFNASSSMPQFLVRDLGAGTPLKFIMYSSNAKGSSDPIVLDGVTFRGFAKFTGPTAVQVYPIHIIIVIIIIVLIICLNTLIIGIWKRSRRKNISVIKNTIQNGTADNFESPAITPTKIDVNGTEPVDNPDVIPSKNSSFRGFIRINKTPPTKRRKMELEVKQNGEIVAVSPGISDSGCHGDWNGSLRIPQLADPKESRI